MAPTLSPPTLQPDGRAAIPRKRQANSRVWKKKIIMKHFRAHGASLGNADMAKGDKRTRNQRILKEGLSGVRKVMVSESPRLRDHWKLLFLAFLMRRGEGWVEKKVECN